MNSIYRFLAYLYDLDCVWDVYDTDEYNSDDNNTGFDVSVGKNYDTIINRYHVLKNFKNRFCCGRKKTMNKDKKLCLLLVPLIFMVLIFVPVIIFEIAPRTFIQKMPDVLFALLNPFVLILGILGGGIWCVTFDHIPVGVYIVILVVYTVVSWTWILRQKKGNAMYFIVWSVLCVLSILMYWKWGDIYYVFMHE